LLARVDILTPNENEALMLLGRPPARVSREEAPELAEALRKLGPRSVVLKLGDQGSYYCGDTGCFHTPAFPVEVRDSTAAGDTFNAALAVALVEGQPVERALLFANAAAAISVTRMGAQASAPARAEVDRFLA
jgi:ribokinase